VGGAEIVPGADNIPRPYARSATNDKPKKGASAAPVVNDKPLSKPLTNSLIKRLTPCGPATDSVANGTYKNNNVAGATWSAEKLKKQLQSQARVKASGTL
jgi:hypothetical protein